MKIIVIGANGTVGSSVIEILKSNHEVILVGNKNGDFKVDITNKNSILELFRKVGKVDAVALTLGKVPFLSFDNLTELDFYEGFNDKLMGQINVVLNGIDFVNDGGSFTLISGILNHKPIANGIIAGTVNGALEGFVVSSQIELPRNIRINLVSPNVIVESLSKYKDFFKGFIPVSANEVALAFKKSIEGKETGQIYKVGY